MPARGQDTAHLETHEEYTEEVKEKITAEELYLENLVNDSQKQINKIKEIGDIPRYFLL